MMIVCAVTGLAVLCFGIQLLSDHSWYSGQTTAIHAIANAVLFWSTAITFLFVVIILGLASLYFKVCAFPRQ